MRNVILKSLVGSKAHHLDHPGSDTDFRAVWIAPTSDLLRIGGASIQLTEQTQVEDDITYYELGKFLSLAIKCNPTILETIHSPVYAATEIGEQLRALFPKLWNSRGVMASFMGYAQSQRNALQNARETHRLNKASVAWLRTLYNAWELLTTGTFTVAVGDLIIGDTLREWKYNPVEWRSVVEYCLEWEDKVKAAYEQNPDKQTDLAAVNDWLLSVRKNNWN